MIYVAGRVFYGTYLCARVIPSHDSDIEIARILFCRLRHRHGALRGLRYGAISLNVSRCTRRWCRRRGLEICCCRSPERDRLYDPGSASREGDAGQENRECSAPFGGRKSWRPAGKKLRPGCLDDILAKNRTTGVHSWVQKSTRSFCPPRNRVLRPGPSVARSAQRRKTSEDCL